MTGRLVGVFGVLGVLGMLGAGAACDDGDGGVPDVPEPVRATVSLEKRGDGLATVTTSPSGLSCDVFCAASDATFEDQAAVEVLVEPSRDAQFVRAFCLAAGQETVRADALDETGRVRLGLTLLADGAPIDWSCVVEHRQVNTLQVVIATGTGTGRVVGTLPASLVDETIKRVDCPDDCVGGYFVDEVETLTATPDAGSIFVRWNFCSESTTSTIDVVMSADENCEAIFDLLQP